MAYIYIYTYEVILHESPYLVSKYVNNVGDGQLYIYATSEGNISHSEHDQMWRLRGELPGGQNKVELVVKVADARGGEGVAFTQLVTTATFENSVGRSTATLTSLIGKESKDSIMQTTHHTWN